MTITGKFVYPDKILQGTITFENGSIQKFEPKVKPSPDRLIGRGELLLAVFR